MPTTVLTRLAPTGDPAPRHGRDPDRTDEVVTTRDRSTTLGGDGRLTADPVGVKTAAAQSLASSQQSGGRL